jgi:hypothetical protein
MTPEEILKGLYDETLTGNGPVFWNSPTRRSSMDMEPQTLFSTP